MSSGPKHDERERHKKIGWTIPRGENDKNEKTNMNGLTQREQLRNKNREARRRMKIRRDLAKLKEDQKKRESQKNKEALAEIKEDRRMNNKKQGFHAVKVHQKKAPTSDMEVGMRQSIPSVKCSRDSSSKDAQKRGNDDSPIQIDGHENGCVELTYNGNFDELRSGKERPRSTRRGRSLSRSTIKTIRRSLSLKRSLSRTRQKNKRQGSGISVQSTDTTPNTTTGDDRSTCSKSSQRSLKRLLHIGPIQTSSLASGVDDRLNRKNDKHIIKSDKSLVKGSKKWFPPFASKRKEKIQNEQTSDRAEEDTSATARVMIVVESEYDPIDINPPKDGLNDRKGNKDKGSFFDKFMTYDDCAYFVCALVEGPVDYCQDSEDFSCCYSNDGATCCGIDDDTI